MEKSIDLQNFDHNAFQHQGRDSVSESKGRDVDRDRLELARVGKTQVLKVGQFAQ